MNKKTVALHNLGCKVNAYETESVTEILKASGYEVVPFEEKADVYVINTCSVTNIADKKSRQMIHRARKLNPDAVVVAMGCYVQSEKGAALIESGAADIIIGNDKKGEIAGIIEEYAGGIHALSRIKDLTRNREYEALSIRKTQGRVRAFMKVQDGCDMFCTYCIIPYVRGRVRSRAADDAVSEAKALSEAGCREIVLSGIHLSSYGRDFGDGTNLLTIIEELHKVGGIQRIRLSSLEPGIITDDFAHALAALPKLCPHFHLSLQSGCDKILRLMNRRYTSGEYANKCEILRKYFDSPSLTTDIITGFPSESEEDFEETYRFVDGIDFFETHVFPYSKRSGTKAADMPDQLSEVVKKQRCARLIELSNQKRHERLEGLIGSVQEVLTEEEQNICGKPCLVGHTKRYEKVAAEKESFSAGELVNVKITDVIPNDGIAYGVMLN